MYAEFSQVSLLSMSNSELFLVKDDDGRIEFDVLKRPPMEFQQECHATATSSSPSSSSSHDIPDDGDRERDAVVLGDHEDKNGGESNVTASKEIEKNKKKRKISLGEFKATDDDNDDDGFKTPTSLDQKIPAVMKQCPPAPRKPRLLPSNKTKAPSTPRSGSAAVAAPTRRNPQPQLDLSQELESLFPKPHLADLHRKVKKARTQDSQ